MKVIDWDQRNRKNDWFRMAWVKNPRPIECESQRNTKPMKLPHQKPKLPWTRPCCAGLPHSEVPSSKWGILRLCEGGDGSSQPVGLPPMVISLGGGPAHWFTPGIPSQNSKQNRERVPRLNNQPINNFPLVRSQALTAIRKMCYIYVNVMLHIA